MSGMVFVLLRRFVGMSLRCIIAYVRYGLVLARCLLQPISRCGICRCEQWCVYDPLAYKTLRLGACEFGNLLSAEASLCS